MNAPVLLGEVEQLVLLTTLRLGEGAYAVPIREELARHGVTFGIRLALGARAQRLVGDVLRSALTMTACGLAIGLVGTLGATRAIASRLYGVRGYDPVTIAVGSFVLLGIALAASAAPAIRAARVDPVLSLRAE